MTRQFKLVTEKEFELLKNMRKPDSLDVSKAPSLNGDAVWNNKLPDDLQSMIFQDYLRRYLKKKTEDERRPVPVKIEKASDDQVGAEPLESTSEKDKQIVKPAKLQLYRPGQVVGVQRKVTNLMKYLEQNGMKTSDGGLNLGGMILDQKEALGFVRSLTDGRVPISKSNTPAVDFLKSQSIPLKFLTPNKHSVFQTTKKKWTKLKF
jgi:hypothetical protein